MKLPIKAQARKIGGTIYVKVDPYFVKRGMVKEGDWVDFEILNIERNDKEKEMGPAGFEPATAGKTIIEISEEEECIVYCVLPPQER